MATSQPTTQVTESDSGSTDQEADRVKWAVDRFTWSWSYASNGYHSRWERAWKLYQNKRVKIGYEGYSDIFVPMTFSTIETMVAALFGSKPTIDYKPPQDRGDQDTGILNALFDKYWDQDQWNMKVQTWGRSSLIYGTSVMFLYWDIDHPVAVNVPIRDFIINPEFSTIDESDPEFYCGRRYLTTIEQLKSLEVIDIEAEDEIDETGSVSKPMRKRFKNLDQLENDNTRAGNDQTDKELKDMFYGSTVTDSPETKQVEVIEIWTGEKVVSVANRRVLIEDEENPYLFEAKRLGWKNPKGIIPFVTQRNYMDEGLFYGRGEIETFADLQEWLNDVTNQRQDALSYALKPMGRASRSIKDMIPQLEAAPGMIIPADPGEFEWLPNAQIPPEAYTEAINIKNDIRETTAANEVVKGVSQDTEATATEIRSQVAQAGQRIGMKITQLENEGFYRLGCLVFRMIQLHVREPVAVRVSGPEGTRWEVFNPLDYQGGEYEPSVQLQQEAEAKRQDEVMAAKEMLTTLIQDPDLDKKELYKLLLPKIYDMDPDEVDKLFVAAPVMPLPGEMPPEDMAMAGDPMMAEQMMMQEEVPIA